MKRLTNLFYFFSLIYSSYAADYQCQNDEFWNGQQCFPCQNNCKCKSYNGCDEQICSDNQILYENKCYTLPTGCKKGDYLTDVEWDCTECQDDYQNIDGVCINKGNNKNIQPSQYSEDRFQAPAFGGLNYLHCEERNDTSLLCTQCKAGYYQDINQFCVSCTNGCLQCKVKYLCQQCKPGYYLKKTVIADEYQQICDSCTSLTCTDFNVHTSCATGLFLENNLCKNCPQFCKTCSSTTTCIDCNDRYYLDSDKSCKPCLANCNSCTNGLNCNQCDEGYTKKDDNSCYLCQNCAKCVYKETEVCNECNDGYYLKTSVDGKTVICEQCSVPNTNWQRCKYTTDQSNANVLVPTQCIINYHLVNNACIHNQKNCFLINSEGECTACVPELSISQTQKICSKCAINCKVCDADFLCSQCEEDYTLNGSICTYKYQCNPQVNGCLKCTTTNICNQCQDKYYLYVLNEQITCKNCPPGCASCQILPNLTGVQCLKCLSEYYKKGEQCLPALNFCLQPSSDGLSCTMCKYGLVSINGRCVPKMDVLAGYRVGVNVGFNEDQLNCIKTYQGYGSLLTLLIGISSLLFV